MDTSKRLKGFTINSKKVMRLQLSMVLRWVVLEKVSLK
jgi:hypothetical protein